MAKDVFIRLRADDQISPTLKKVGAASKEVAADFKQMGTAADAAGQDVEQSARNLDQMKESAKDVGVGIGILVAGVAAAAQSARDLAIANNTLDRSYGDASDQMRQFAESIQDTTNYSNDAALQSANIAATLARNYGFTADEIQRVLQISTDLAATSGLALEDTTYRVVAALRGEAEAAEALGLTMNQQAIDRDNLTLSMSNEEAAHFRLNALYEQSAFAQGAAAEQADSFYGRLVDLAHGAQDAAQSFGAALGPVGQLGAFMADNAAKTVIFGAALTKLAQGAQGLNAISRELTGLSAASAGLSGITALLTGPAGIVAAAGAAVLGITALASYLTDEYQSATDVSVAATDNLTHSLIDLGKQGQLSLLQQQIAQSGLRIGEYSDSLNEAADAQDTLKTRIESTTASLGAAPGYALYSRGLEDLTKAEQDAIDTNDDLFVSLEELEKAASGIGPTMANTGETAQEFAAAWALAQDDINAILSDAGPGAEEAQKHLRDTFMAVEAGTVTMGVAQVALSEWRDEMDATNAAAVANGNVMAENTVAGQKYAAVLDAIGLSYNDMSVEAARAQAAMTPGEIRLFEIKQEELTKARNLADLLKIVGQNYNTMSVEAAQAQAAAEQFQRATNNQLEITADNYNQISIEAARAQTAAVAAQKQLAIAADSFQVPSVESAMAGAQMSDIDIKVFLDDQEAQDKAKKIAAATEEMTRAFNATTAAVTGTSQALDSGFRVVVSNTNAIADSAQGVQDWADELIGAQGVAAQIDDLLQRGIITQQQYNDAQAAYTPIAEANARIQDDVLAIQTAQAPVIAELTQQQADYMDSLATAAPDQQAFALAMMDSATSAEALQLATSLLGENGDVFAPMVEAAANLDPYLATILEQMGLIEQQPDGTYTVTLDDQASSPLADLNATMEELNGTIATLITYLDTDPFNDGMTDVELQMAAADQFEATPIIDIDTSGFDSGISGVNSNLDTTGSTTAIPTVDLNDNASGTLNNILGLLFNLDGMSATTYVNTVYTSSGSSVATHQPTAADGRVIQRAHGGGIPFEGGEAGYELVKRATGGMAVLPGHGMYTGQPGDMVFSHPASKSMIESGALGGINVTVNIDGDVIGETGFAERMADSIADAMVVSVDRRNRGYARA